MKHSRILYTILASLLLIGVGTTFSGCDKIHEGIHPCPSGIRLKLFYDYNLKFSDALPREIKNVSVYIFDHETGAPVDEVHTKVGQIKEREYEVNLDHLDRGKYDFVIWCYGESAEHFTINPTAHPSRLPEHHTCLMSEDEANPGHQSADIGRLYHGRLVNADCTADQTINTFEVPLVKNTNVVRLVLQHLNGEYLDPSKFDITLESDNGHMAHDNQLIDGHHRIYHPWAVTSGMTNMARSPYDSRAITSASALVAEHTIGRIIPKTGVTIHVKNTDTGEDIINIPFVDYALLVKGKYPPPEGMTEPYEMSDEEYLDRQDEYNMVFFLDEQLKWYDQLIYINSWRLVLQQEEI